MPKLPFTKDHFLMLLFKDEFPRAAGRGFPLVSKSPTILRHLAINDPSLLSQHGLESREADSATLQQLSLFDDATLGLTQIIADPLWPSAPPDSLCVWGWWRKPWEHHPELFARLAKHCKSGHLVNVLLFNPYMRRVYPARLHAVHSLPYITSVALPSTWAAACPSYYRSEPRLCGAFFLLDIDKQDADDTLASLSALAIDSSSFESTPLGLPMIIQPEASVDSAGTALVDRPVDRDRLRLSDRTLFLLRGYRQVDFTRRLLTMKRYPGDLALMSAFAETNWPDTHALLRSIPPNAWNTLARSPDTLTQIAIQARRAGLRLTRFDMELVAWLFSKSSLRPLLVNQDGCFSSLGTAIRDWVLAGSHVEARLCASSVFKSAWLAASSRYTLASLDDYFSKLPPLEAVASAVHHEIDGKFYRDHLSHNVRAALLAAHLASASAPPVPSSVDAQAIAFFSGLLHDIAFPLSAFPSTVGKLASVLSSIQGPDFVYRTASLLESDFLHVSLHYTALLASVPSLLSAYKDGCSPWNDPGTAIAACNTRLLDELLLSARAENHAIISAAIVFHRAVRARGTDTPDGRDKAVRDLMMEMTGRSANPRFQELLAIVQCIALHDRKASLAFHPVSTTPRDAPAPLTWQHYALPITVAIADEFQEWGRPIGSLESMGVVDGSVALDGLDVRAAFEWNTDSGVFEKVPYSMLFMLIGKLRACRGFRRESSDDQVPFGVQCTLDQLKAFRVNYAAYKDFSLEFGREAVAGLMSSWPRERDVQRPYRGGDGQHLFSIRVDSEAHTGNDFLIAEGDQETCSRIAAMAQRGMRLGKLEVSGMTFVMTSECGGRFAGTMVEFMHGKIDRNLSTPSNHFPSLGSCTVVRVAFDPAPDMCATVGPDSRFAQLLAVHPHFLDSDWRFSERTARWIVDSARHYVGDGRICYLGCPTLAAWHGKMYPDEDTWRLLDRGHFALARWRAAVVPTSRCIEYDVYSRVPKEMIGRFGVVVTDPPWYKSEYEAFSRRAGELVGANGIVMLSCYPPVPPYKTDKYSRFGTIIERELRRPVLLGSMEIDYDIPEFECSWGGHTEFVHPGFRVYRPGYLDVFRVKSGGTSSQDATVPGRLLPLTMAMNGGHHIRYREDIVFPLSASVARRPRVKRVADLSSDVIAWSSRNAVVSIDSAGSLVRSIDEIVNLIEERERVAGAPGAGMWPIVNW